MAYETGARRARLRIAAAARAIGREVMTAFDVLAQRQYASPWEAKGLIHPRER